MTKETQSLDEFIGGLIDSKLNYRASDLRTGISLRFWILLLAVIALGTVTYSLCERVDRLENQPHSVPSPLLPAEPQSN